MGFRWTSGVFPAFLECPRWHGAVGRPFCYIFVFHDIHGYIWDPFSTFQIISNAVHEHFHLKEWVNAPGNNTGQIGDSWASRDRKEVLPGFWDVHNGTIQLSWHQWDYLGLNISNCFKCLIPTENSWLTMTLTHINYITVQEIRHSSCFHIILSVSSWHFALNTWGAVGKTTGFEHRLTAHQITRRQTRFKLLTSRKTYWHRQFFRVTKLQHSTWKIECSIADGLKTVAKSHGVPLLTDWFMLGLGCLCMPLQITKTASKHHHRATKPRSQHSRCKLFYFRRKFKSQISDNMGRWTSTTRQKLKRGENQKRESANTRKSTKVAKHCFFNDLWLRRVETVGSLQRCGAKHMYKSKCTKHTKLGPFLEVEMSRKCTLLCCEAHLEVKMYNHFCKLLCRKSAPCCGAKYIWKSKCTKHTRLRPLLQVAMSEKWSCCGAKHMWKSKCTKYTRLGPLLQVAVGKMKLLWREAHLEVKMYKTHQARTTFAICCVEKVHLVAARSTFGSPSVQNTPGSDHFCKLLCRKSAPFCGAKHIWKPKCTKHTRVGPLLQVAMSKKCKLLWREAHVEVKMYKIHQARTTFASCYVQKAQVVVAQSAFGSEKC